MTRLTSGLIYFLLLIVASIATYCGFAWWAWGDIPVQELEQKYGDADLKIAQIDGAPIRYRLQGQALSDQPTVVLVHSHFMDMQLWDQWLPLLTPHYSVLRYDLSGHGLTGPDESGIYTVERDVALLEGLLNELNIQKTLLVGSSLGGNIAFTFTAKNPTQVSALTLINSGGLKKPSGKGRSGKDMPSWADAVFPLVPPAALKSFLLWMTVDDATVSESTQTRFVDFFRRFGNRKAELARLRQFETGDPEPLLATITAPTLILWGADNPQLPVNLASRFKDKLTAAKQVNLKIYEGAGHVLPIERAAASANDTLAFFQSLGSGSQTGLGNPQ